MSDEARDYAVIGERQHGRPYTGRRRIYFALGQEIRRLRLRRGLSITSMSAQTGVTKSNVSQLERGLGGATIPTFLAIAAALGVPPGEILENAFIPVYRLRKR